MAKAKSKALVKGSGRPSRKGSVAIGILSCGFDSNYSKCNFTCGVRPRSKKKKSSKVKYNPRGFRDHPRLPIQPVPDPPSPQFALEGEKG
jgi:hypothetical protein